jgi:hypothetical protein
MANNEKLGEEARGSLSEIVNVTGKKRNEWLAFDWCFLNKGRT